MIAVMKCNLRRLAVSPHCWAILILSVLYMENNIEPVRAFCMENGAKLSPIGWMAYLMNDATVSGFMALGCLGLLFNAPCADDMQRYLLLRCGRRSWARGQALYCAAVCALYMLALTLIVFLLNLPWTEWTLDWGAGLTAFIDDFGYETYESLIYFDVWIPRVYTALSAYAVEFGLHVLVFFALSMLMANINVIIDRRAGFAALAVPMAFDLLLEEYFSDAVKYFSPLTLCRLSGLDYGDGMNRPPVWFAAAAAVTAGALLTALLVRYVRGREIRMEGGTA